jgi:hypothetical protein
MAEPIAAPPTPTPSPAPAPVPAPAPAPAPPTGATPAISQPPTPSDTPKKDSARERMRKDLAKIGKPPNGAIDPATKAPAAPDPNAAQPAPVDGKAPVDSTVGKPGKESPWKLVDRYKGRVTELESEISKLKTTPISAEDRKGFEDRTTKAEARVKELEDHMRFVDYSKTEDFNTKYVKPYNKAWENAVSELKEITITDGAGHERAVTPQDILDLVNLPLGKARELADQYFGKFADDAMSHRKEISKLWQAQQAALENEKKVGGETLKQQTEAAQKNFQAMQSNIKDVWQKENAALLADKTYGPMFSKREGDTQWNDRLEKGFALVDRAFSENPSDPQHTSEQRQEIVRRHTAIRNRAAAWGAVKAENETLRGQIDEMKKELEQYKGSEPGTNGGRIAPNGNGGKPMTARERMHEDLRKRAKML